MILGLLGLLAPILSPVSWIHAYATAFLPLCLLWGEVLRRRVSGIYLALLTLASLLVGSYLPPRLLLLFAQRNHYQAFSVSTVFFFAVLLGLIFYRMAQSGVEHPELDVSHP